MIAAAAQNNSRIKRKDNRMKNFLTMNPVWIREPKQVSVTEDKVEVITEPGTDLWQRTYYGFQNDNAPVLQARTGERYFSFVVRILQIAVGRAAHLVQHSLLQHMSVFQTGILGQYMSHLRHGPQ